MADQPEDKWARFSLTSPPNDGDPQSHWVSEVLWIILDKMAASAERITKAEQCHNDCVAAHRVNALWIWGRITIACVGGGATIVGLIYWASRIRAGA